MTGIIPREWIKHLEWTPGQPQPELPEVPELTPHASKSYNIDDILKGKTFLNTDKDSANNWIGLPNALQQALDFAGPTGIIATMPELIAAKLKADKKHDFWKQWNNVHTEENIGIDTKGRFYKKDEPVLVVVNGGGILTPDRIRIAYAEGLIYHSAKYTDQEFDYLLDGKLPDGKKISLFLLDKIQAGVSNLPHQFGVVMPYTLAQGTASGYYQKKAFVENPLVIARAGGLENLEEYFEKAKGGNNSGDAKDKVGSWHPFNGRDASQAQGRVLFLGSYYGGLSGNFSLSDNGRFVGVAPEAHGAKKQVQRFL